MEQRLMFDPMIVICVQWYLLVGAIMSVVSLPEYEKVLSSLFKGDKALGVEEFIYFILLLSGMVFWPVLIIVKLDSFVKRRFKS